MAPGLPRLARRLVSRRGRRSAAIALALTLMTACGSTVQITGSGTGGAGAGDGLSRPGTSTASQGGTTGELSTSTSGGAPATVPGGSTSGVGPAAVPTEGARPGASAPSSVVASALPVKGRGYDAKTVRIGVMTQQDVQAVAEGLGVSSVDSGDQLADIRVVLAHVNATGGLFGRRVVAEIVDIQSAGDPEVQGQAACEHFTRDVPVVAVYAMALVGDTPSFRACMAKAKLPVLAGGGQAFDERVFSELGGYYTLMPFPSYDAFVPSFVDRLVAQGYFSPWNETLGGPGTAKDKVGFLCPDTPVGHRVGAIVSRELKRVGHPAANATYYSTSNTDVSGYVLRFKSDGITHVLFCDLGLFVFATQAETQHYRPRYGVSTFNTPVLFLQGVVPDAQLVGSMGSGFIPTLDVDAQRDTSPLPAALRCEAIAKKGGLVYAPNRRFAHAVLRDTCDVLLLVVASAKASNALDGPGLLRGLGSAGAGWDAAVTFRSGLSPVSHAMPAASRDLFFDTGCSCYRYRGGTFPFR